MLGAAFQAGTDCCCFISRVIYSSGLTASNKGSVQSSLSEGSVRWVVLVMWSLGWPRARLSHILRYRSPRWCAKVPMLNRGDVARARRTFCRIACNLRGEKLAWSWYYDTCGSGNRTKDLRIREDQRSNAHDPALREIKLGDTCIFRIDELLNNLPPP